MSNAKRVAVGGIELEYEERGERAGNARPFVLVHGYTGSRDDFADVHATLAEEGRTVLVDQRGHGGSTNTSDPASYHFAPMVDDLTGFLDAVEIERCDLLGHSMGGMVALRFALARPERVASLVLMDTSPGPVMLMPLEMMRAGAKLGREHGMGALAEVMRAAAADDPNRAAASRRCEEEQGPDRYWARIRAKLLAMDPEAMDGLAGVLAEHESATPRLGEIQCPTLVIVGEEDRPFRRPSETLAASIPDAELVVVPEAAHSPQFENRAAWLDAVLRHLRRARSEPPTPSGSMT